MVVAICLLVVCVAGIASAQGSLAARPLTGKAGQEAASIASVPTDTGAYVQGELIVGLADEGDDSMADAVREAIESSAQASTTVLARPSEGRGATLLVTFDDVGLAGDGLAAAARSIGDTPGVSLVQPNYSYSTASGEARATEVAADEDVDKQYYLNSWDGDHGANVAAAWGEVGTTGKVDVAVLDTGVYVMPEYDDDAQLLTGADSVADNFHQEFDMTNLDIAHGVDVVHSDGSSLLPIVNESNPYGDDNGHGTHVSAIIAANAQTAKTPNALPMGIAGVSQNARVIPVKVLDAGGEGSTADFIRAYDYLIGLKEAGKLPNLHVVNMSLSLSFDDEGDGESVGETDGYEDAPDEFSDEMDEGSDEGDDELERWINKAAELGIATVCAAGNEGSSALTYPSDYDACISVTALDESGKNASYSNLNRYKDISAPGSGIYSAWGSQADAYATLDGTSQATAVVSGILSMMWAKDSKLTVDGAKAAIYETAREVPGNSEPVGLTASAAGATGSGLMALGVTEERNGSHGAIDAAAAVKQAGVSPIPEEVTPEPEVEPGVTPETEPEVKPEVKPEAKSEVKPTATPKTCAVPTGAKLAYTGRQQTGVPGGAGYTLSGTVKATNAGSYRATATLAAGYVWSDGSTGAKTVTWFISPITLKATVTLPKATYTYTGSAVKPNVTVKASGKTLRKGADFTVSYSSNKNPGTARVTVKGTGNYRGTAKKSFKIALGKVRLGKVSSGKSSFTAAWSRQKSGKVGYQLRYSRKSNMKGAVTKLVSRNATTKLKVKRLKAGKTYYVQVRSYKKIGRKSYSSSWSARKSVKVK